MIVEKVKVELPQRIVDEWNEMMAAAGLLKLGKGKIVKKNIKGKTIRYVKLIG